jgi:gluconokinase
MSATTSTRRPDVLVVMGVSGCGKSTVAALLAERLGWRFAEADDFHSPHNIALMASGAALTDADRAPWLAALRDWVDTEDTPAVLTCSALRRPYRDVLRSSRGRVRFVHLDGTASLIGARLDRRGGHFMPAELLGSQIETLEPLGPDEDGVVIDVNGEPDLLAAGALAALDLIPI